MTFSLIISDMRVHLKIGVTAEERRAPQPVLINVTIELDETVKPRRDDIAETVSYDDIVQNIRQLSLKEYHLLETLAQDIGALCLKDSRARSAIIRAEKATIYSDCKTAGVELRIQSD